MATGEDWWEAKGLVIPGHIWSAYRTGWATGNLGGGVDGAPRALSCLGEHRLESLMCLLLLLALKPPHACSVAPHVPRVCAEDSRRDSLLPSPQARVLVTHGISYPQTDFVIVLSDGHVSEMGTYSALLQRDGSFASFLRNYAPDEDKEHQEANNSPGICHSWLFHIPLPSLHLPCPGASERLWTALVLCRKVLGTWIIQCDVRHQQEGK